jgi:hypothetical protein
VRNARALLWACPLYVALLVVLFLGEPDHGVEAVQWIAGALPAP